MTIKLDNVTFAYRRNSPDALRDASASFGAGIHLLLGPNNAGKSTMLRIIAGLLVPDSGKCYFDKEVTACHSPHTTKEIFLLTPEATFPLRDLDEMARLHAPFYPHFDREAMDSNLAMFGLSGSDPLAEMSLGTRHKAFISYALALGTRVLMLDEPAEGLDMNAKETLAHMIAEAAAADPNRCIIVATHTVQEMRNLFDTVTILSHGSVVINISTAVVSERLAFIADSIEHADALVYRQGVDGPTQIVPSGGVLYTPIDYTLLFMAATGAKVSQLQELLS